jgi:glycosyltransferase involved in cell wall biosynthesis
MNPNVAIIITNYNYGKYVIQAINSAINQDYAGNLRVYVLDDGSSDDSWEKISNITDHQYCATINEPYYSGPIDHRQKDNIYAFRINNSGASTGRNVAIWQSWDWAEIFGILDADDAYFENKVSILVEKLIEYEEVGVAYADYNNVYSGYRKTEFKESYSRDILLNRCIVHSNSLIKKSKIESVILPNKEIFDSRLHGAASKGFIGCTEDYDLWLRLSKVCIFTHVPKILAIANQTGQNQSYKMTSEIFKENAKILSSR